MNGNCSFCGKRADEVFRIIVADVGVPDSCKICNECIGRCCNMIADELSKIAGQIMTLPPPAGPQGSTP